MILLTPYKLKVTYHVGSLSWSTPSGAVRDPKNRESTWFSETMHICIPQHSVQGVAFITSPTLCWMLSIPDLAAPTLATLVSWSCRYFFWSAGRETLFWRLCVQSASVTSPVLNSSTC